METAKLTDSGKASQVAISPEGEYVVYAKREANSKVSGCVTSRPGAMCRYSHRMWWHSPGSSLQSDGNYIYFVRSDKSTDSSIICTSCRCRGGAPRQRIREYRFPPPVSRPMESSLYLCGGFQSTTAAELRVASAYGTRDRLLVRLPARPYTSGKARPRSPDGKKIAVSMPEAGKQLHWD